LQRAHPFAKSSAWEIEAELSAHQLVLATRNSGKIREFRRILEEIAPGEINLIGLGEFPDLFDVDETGTTFLENALLKARTVSRETGLPAIADDSGLCVDALGGNPGIFSARWSGVHGDDDANLKKVLAQLEEVEAAGEVDRRAHFTCVAVFASLDGHCISEEGFLQGTILRSPVGAHGFGYDPIFLPVGSQLSLAQMEASAKDAISHRGQSLRAIAPRVTELLGTLR
jgi:XTP/dITP diphosphohydrolase